MQQRSVLLPRPTTSSTTTLLLARRPCERRWEALRLGWATRLCRPWAATALPLQPTWPHRRPSVRLCGLAMRTAPRHPTSALVPPRRRTARRRPPTRLHRPLSRVRRRNTPPRARLSAPQALRMVLRRARNGLPQVPVATLCRRHTRRRAPSLARSRRVGARLHQPWANKLAPSTVPRPPNTAPALRSGRRPARRSRPPLLSTRQLRLSTAPARPNSALCRRAQRAPTRLPVGLLRREGVASRRARCGPTNVERSSALLSLFLLRHLLTSYPNYDRTIHQQKKEGAVAFAPLIILDTDIHSSSSSQSSSPFAFPLTISSHLVFSSFSLPTLPPRLSFTSRKCKNLLLERE